MPHFSVTTHAAYQRESAGWRVSYQLHATYYAFSVLIAPFRRGGTRNVEVTEALPSWLMAGTDCGIGCPSEPLSHLPNAVLRERGRG